MRWGVRLALADRQSASDKAAVMRCPLHAPGLMKMTWSGRIAVLDAEPSEFACSSSTSRGPMPKDREFYAAFKATGGGYEYSIGDEATVRKFVDQKNSTSSNNIDDFGEKDEEDHQTQDEGVHEFGLDTVVEFVLSHFHMAMLIELIEHDYTKSFVNSSIRSKLDKRSIEKSELDGFSLYKIDAHLRDEIIESHTTSNMIESGTKKLVPAFLLGMVAAFDAQIVDLVERMIRKNPSRFVGSERAVPMRLVLESGGIDEIISAFVSDELYSFSRGSHDEQTGYIEKYFSISIKEKWKRWPDFIEVFERRNLVAHGEKLFTRRYVDICKKHGHKGSDELYGKSVELRPEYILQCLDLLGEYGVLLGFSLWRKHAPESEREAFSSLNEVAFKLIHSKRYALAGRILEYALSLKGADISENTRRMMVVNWASAARSSVSEAKCREIIGGEDWSACSWQFKIAIAALTGDVEGFIKLIPEAKNSDFPIGNFRRWPVFRFIRDEEKINTSIEGAYGERITKITETKHEVINFDGDDEASTKH